MHGTRATLAKAIIGSANQSFSLTAVCVLIVEAGNSMSSACIVAELRFIYNSPGFDWSALPPLAGVSCRGPRPTRKRASAASSRCLCSPSVDYNTPANIGWNRKAMLRHFMGIHTRICTRNIRIGI